MRMTSLEFRNRWDSKWSSSRMQPDIAHLRPASSRRRRIVQDGLGRAPTAGLGTCAKNGPARWPARVRFLGGGHLARLLGLECLLAPCGTGVSPMLSGTGAMDRAVRIVGSKISAEPAASDETGDEGGRCRRMPNRRRVESAGLPGGLSVQFFAGVVGPLLLGGALSFGPAASGDV
jgi:hypothetical protein